MNILLYKSLHLYPTVSFTVVTDSEYGKLLISIRDLHFVIMKGHLYEYTNI